MWLIPVVTTTKTLTLYYVIDTGVEGSGDDGVVGGGSGSQMVSMDSFRECSDRVMMPCDSEEFITVSLLLFTLLPPSSSIVNVIVLYSPKEDLEFVTCCIAATIFARTRKRHVGLKVSDQLLLTVR